MSYDPHITSLTEALVKSIVSGPNTDERKRSALGAFSKLQYERINQFEISRRLDGLEEKARILNNDPWANALENRVSELSSVSEKWVPEILSFMLELSDRPIQEARLDRLAALTPDAPPTPLTWADILADDPLDDEHEIWKDVNSKDDDSDEAYDVDKSSTNSSKTTPESISSKSDEILEQSIEDFIEPYRYDELERITKAQFWNNRSFDSSQILSDRNLNQPVTLMTELQVVREVIFMLLGLPTSIYSGGENNQIKLSQTIALEHLSQASTTAQLKSFAEIGEKLMKIRQWVKRITAVPLEQTFQASIASRLREVDHSLSSIQAEILDLNVETKPSLLRLYNETCETSRFILQLTPILTILAKLPILELPFLILEHMFDASYANQMSGDSDGFEYMAKLFLECFRTYLRPIRLWMEQGLLDAQDCVVFIEKNAAQIPLSSLWQDQFHLVMNPSGDLRAPKFLHLAARKILNSGKNIAILRMLGCEPDEPEKRNLEESTMSFTGFMSRSPDVLCLGEMSSRLEDLPNAEFETPGMGHPVESHPRDLPESNYQSPGTRNHPGYRNNTLTPFPLIFEQAFDRWIANIHESPSKKLRHTLEKDCELPKSLDALEHIYFGRNGALNDTFALALCERLEKNPYWKDAFSLTDLIKNSFSTITCVHLDRIGVRSMRSMHRRWGEKHRREPMGVLDDVRVVYELPWPNLNIVRPNSIDVYQRIWILLTQLRRAKNLLERHKLLKYGDGAHRETSLLIFAVRHRLVWFTNVMLTYLTDMVLSVSTASMRSSMRLAVNMDGMVKAHAAHIAQIEHQCCLTKQHKALHQAIVSLLDLTILYSDVESRHADIICPNQKRIPTKPTSTLRRSAKEPETEVDTQELSDRSDVESDCAEIETSAVSASMDIEKLRHISDTFVRLLAFITAAVQGVNKRDSAPCWEVLASSLASGLQ